MEQITVQQIIQQLGSTSSKLQKNDSIELKVKLPNPEAMANNDCGGFIILGVSNDGSVVGLNKEEQDRLPTFILHIVNELTSGIKYAIHGSSVNDREFNIFLYD